MKYVTKFIQYIIPISCEAETDLKPVFKLNLSISKNKYDTTQQILTLYLFNPQYYLQARVKALQIVYPDYVDDGHQYLQGRSSFNYPRPLSAPPSPSSSRHTTPAPSVHGSDDEDSVDDEKELQELGLAQN